MLYDGLVKWIEKIKNSDFSEENKEALIEYIQYYLHDRKYYPKFNIFIYALITLNYKDYLYINLKDLKYNELFAIFNFIQKTRWLYSKAAFQVVEYFILDLLEFLNKKYKWGLEPRHEYHKFVEYRKNQLKSQMETEYGTN